MTLLTKHLEAGWHEVETGLIHLWAAERYFSRPGASSTVIRVEAESANKLNEAIELRQSQLAGADEPIKDTITNDGTLVTGDQHSALQVAGVEAVTVPDAEQITEPVPNEDEEKQMSGDPSEGVVDAPQEPADAPDLDAPADAESSETPESQSTPSAEVDATPAAAAAAEEHGVDLASVEGSGQEGRVLKADVEAAASDQE